MSVFFVISFLLVFLSWHAVAAKFPQFVPKSWHNFFVVLFLLPLQRLHFRDKHYSDNAEKVVQYMHVALC